MTRNTGDSSKIGAEDDLAKVTGSCLCGGVRYQISGPISTFQFCHCSRCRKVTGSAHASNMFVSPEHFQWLQGEALVQRFEPLDTRHFATCFCRQCGSNLPWMNKGGTLMIVPAGCLDQDPEIRPQQNIFWDSKAPWYQGVEQLPFHDQLPPRKKHR
ncbi:MAG: GFA family protein [Motiliproteus sp.]|nr:GFA family protein [Motiliproteus sp.]MCW9050732.1 GFA family protein [Motiliproteus sp.]